MDGIRRFLGDSPMRVALRLIVISFIVGIVMTYLGITPLEVIDRGLALVDWAWRNGAQALSGFLSYFLIGAVIVVPVFLISRIFAARKS